MAENGLGPSTQSAAYSYGLSLGWDSVVSAADQFGLWFFVRLSLFSTFLATVVTTKRNRQTRTSFWNYGLKNSGIFPGKFFACVSGFAEKLKNN